MVYLLLEYSTPFFFPSLCVPSCLSDLLIDGIESIMKLRGGLTVLISLPAGWPGPYFPFPSIHKVLPRLGVDPCWLLLALRPT
jgi:hypothetical protein